MAGCEWRVVIRQEKEPGSMALPGSSSRNEMKAYEGFFAIISAMAFWPAASISSGVMSNLWVATCHEWPKGSTSEPQRSPQNMSESGCFTSAPADTADLNTASQSGTIM